MDFSEVRRYGSTWFQVDSPDIRGYSWFLHVKDGGYDVEYAGADDDAPAETFSHEPASPDEQQRIDDANIVTLISLARREILNRIGEQDPVVPLAEVGRALYGAQWQSALSRALGVADRTVRRWAADPANVHDDVRVDLIPLIDARIEELSRVRDVLKDQVLAIEARRQVGTETAD